MQYPIERFRIHSFHYNRHLIDILDFQLNLRSFFCVILSALVEISVVFCIILFVLVVILFT